MSDWKTQVWPRAFGSDNHCGVHPEILQAMIDVNHGHVGAYQTDPVSAACMHAWRAQFGAGVDVHYVFGGTAANILALQALTPSYASILCSDVAHIHVDECAAPEKHIGCKVQTLPSVHGKIRPESIVPHLIRNGDQHYAAPRVLSLTQPTEVGTVYTLEELRALCDTAHAHGLKVHMDGARLICAAASLNTTLRAMTRDVGVDVLSFGGTKNGLMMGEAVVFFEPQSQALKYMRKQAMQLPSKTRFFAAQFDALLSDDLHRRIANHSNAKARELAQALQALDGVRILHPVESNVVFAELPKAWVKPLRQEIFFYVWHQKPTVARLMTSFDTTSSDIARLVDAMRTLEAKHPSNVCSKKIA